MGSIIKGIIIGFVIVLPGMSGGTVFVIFGIYEDLVRDLVKLRIRPYLPLLGGMLIGIYLGGTAFTLFFEEHRNITVTLLLGCLLASIKPVLKDNFKLSFRNITILLIGLIIGYFLVDDSLNVGSSQEYVPWYVLIIGGALSSATMIIPGIPGSSVLIIMDIYDIVLGYIKELNIIKLSIYVIGAAMGAVLLLNALEKIYDKYKEQLSYAFAGLILGSTRALIPSELNFSVVLTFVIGFCIVWYLGGKENKSIPNVER